MPQPTIVLVHGAWADASSWSAVASRSTTAEVPGSHVSMLSHPKVTLDTAVD